MKNDKNHAHYFNAHLTLLDADINVTNGPYGKEESHQASEDGKRLTQGIHQGVVVGYLNWN